MTNLNKIKDESALVQAVMALDSYFSDLDRISAKIESMDLKSEFEIEQTQKLLSRFAECGNGISEQVVAMSKALNEARAQAEAVARVVTARADHLQSLQETRQKKMDDFRSLGKKVRELTLSLNELKRPDDKVPIDEDKVKIAIILSEFEIQLQPLIEDAHNLLKVAQDSKMKVLEQGADSMRQSLLAIRERLIVFKQTSDH